MWVDPHPEIGQESPEDMALLEVIRILQEAEEHPEVEELPL